MVGVRERPLASVLLLGARFCLLACLFYLKLETEEDLWCLIDTP
jgi:hypothetical protein